MSPSEILSEQVVKPCIVRGVELLKRHAETKKLRTQYGGKKRQNGRNEEKIGHNQRTERANENGIMRGVHRCESVRTDCVLTGSHCALADSSHSP